tara:strand:+ start:149 stop:652 length:504 start_codon:yes stop_codon:yes gene_type:complete
MIIGYYTHKTDFAKICWESQEAYAERCGVEFKLVPIESCRLPQGKKYEVILNNCPFDEYFLYLDWDVLISSEAKPIFTRTESLTFKRDYINFAAPNSGLIYGKPSDLVNKKVMTSYRKYLKLLPFSKTVDEDAIYRAWRDSDITVEGLDLEGFTHYLGALKNKLKQT